MSEPPPPDVTSPAPTRSSNLPICFNIASDSCSAGDGGGGGACVSWPLRPPKPATAVTKPARRFGSAIHLDRGDMTGDAIAHPLAIGLPTSAAVFLVHPEHNTRSVAGAEGRAS